MTKIKITNEKKQSCKKEFWKLEVGTIIKNSGMCFLIIKEEGFNKAICLVRDTLDKTFFCDSGSSWDKSFNDGNFEIIGKIKEIIVEDL